LKIANECIKGEVVLKKPMANSLKIDPFCNLNFTFVEKIV